MSRENPDYREKRNFIRMKIESPVAVKLEADSEILQGLCHDLSGGGLSITVERQLATGTELEVTLSSGHGQGAMLRAKAQVIRVEPKGDGAENYTLGLEILEMLN